MKVIGNITLIPMETNYIIAYNTGDSISYEVCNPEALVSRLEKHFEGGLIGSIQVMVINERPPYFEEINKEKLMGMYRAHKNSLEGKASS